MAPAVVADSAAAEGPRVKTETLLLVGLGGLLLYFFTRPKPEAAKALQTEDDDFWDISASDILGLWE